MSKIFVPESSIYNKCYTAQNGVIRAYDHTPAYNTSYTYREYFIHDNYNYRDISGQWGQQGYTTFPVCLSSNDISSNYYYRVDFYQILIMFVIFAFFIFYIPLWLFSKIFKRRV